LCLLPLEKGKDGDVSIFKVQLLELYFILKKDFVLYIRLVSVEAHSLEYAAGFLR
jgi:hypothetical protein